MRKRGTFAHSLIEVLVAAAIVAIIGTAVAAVLAGGLRVWERVHDELNSQTAMAIGMEMLERDVHNACHFYGISFEGDVTHFAMAVPMKISAAGGSVYTAVGTIDYAYDSGRHALVRARWAFPSARATEASPEVVIPDIADATCEFLKCLPEERTARWQTAWHEKNAIPQAIRLKWRPQGKDDSARFHQRTLILPGV
jgi:type II secretory pathway pseudopilin PulG